MKHFWISFLLIILTVATFIATIIYSISPLDKFGWEYININRFLLSICIIAGGTFLLAFSFFRKKKFARRLIITFPIATFLFCIFVIVYDYIDRDYPYGFTRDDEFANVSNFPNDCMENIPYEPMSIIIQYAHSYKKDLKNNIYTVYIISDSASQIDIPIKISQQEQKLIQERVYKECLTNLPDSVYFDDNCMIMPKLSTILTIQAQNFKKIFIIDRGCKGFRTPKPAHKVLRFIQFVDSIVTSKPAIKNAPKSNILYM